MLKRNNKKRWTENTARVNAMKSVRGCLDCGENHPAVLQFHHRDGLQGGKRLNKFYYGSWSVLEIEMAKCDILCANCHLKRHYEEGTGFFGQAVNA
jgi:hypothetical protein